MPKFCGKCGSPLDPATGICLNCNPQQAAAPQVPYGAAPDNGEQGQLPYQNEIQPEQSFYYAASENLYAAPEYDPYDEAEQTEPKKSHGALIAVLVILILLVASAGAMVALQMTNVVDIPFLSFLNQDAEEEDGDSDSGSKKESKTEAAQPAAVPATEETSETQTEPAVQTTVPAPTTTQPATAPPASVPAPSGNQVQLEDDMRLRSGPGTNYSYSRVLSRGTSAILIGIQGEWANINVNGVTGWVHGPTAFPSWWSGGAPAPAAPTESYPYTAVLKNTMKLRSGPSTQYSVKTTINVGSTVTVQYKQTNSAGELWAYITYGSFEGWVRVQEAGV